MPLGFLIQLSKCSSINLRCLLHTHIALWDFRVSVVTPCKLVGRYQRFGKKNPYPSEPNFPRTLVLKVRTIDNIITVLMLYQIMFLQQHIKCPAEIII